MSNRINNAINLIGTEIINTLQDISKPIVDNIDIVTLADLEPRSWRRRLLSLEDPIKINLNNLNLFFLF